MPFDTPIVEVRDLTFEYSSKRALDAVSFSIPAGSVTAMVGPNGAGKTTLLRCLAALEEPLSGTILIDGVDTAEAPRAVHRKLGFLQDFFGVYETLTVQQNVLHAAAVMEVPAQSLEEAASQALHSVGLSDLSRSKANQLSRGQRQRLALARSIVHRPRLLLLDEPASGLDPDARRGLSDLIRKLQAEGATLIVSSHILTELEDYSTHMLTVRGGQVTGPVQIGSASITSRRLGVAVLSDTDGLQNYLISRADVSHSSRCDNSIFFDFSGDDAAQRDLLRELIAKDFAVTEFKAGGEDMEQLYFKASRS